MVFTCERRPWTAEAFQRCDKKQRINRFNGTQRRSVLSFAIAEKFQRARERARGKSLADFLVCS